MEVNQKIFGIGLQRTGTTSLWSALITLGIKAAPHAIPLFYNLDDEYIKRFEAFMDNPIPLVYQELDKKCPGSKFILTTRHELDWLNSVEWLFSKRLVTMDKKLKSIADEIHYQFYGTTEFDREIFRRKWRTYHQEVHAYFSNRKEDMLTLDLSHQADWRLLCNFLARSVPDQPFPWLNSSK